MDTKEKSKKRPLGLLAALTVIGLAYPFGLLVNSFSGNGLRCDRAGITAVSLGCSDWFLVGFGLFFSIGFTLTAFHFGLNWLGRRMIIILLTSLVLISLIDYAVRNTLLISIGGGIVVGLAVSMYRNKKSA